MLQECVVAFLLLWFWLYCWLTSHSDFTSCHFFLSLSCDDSFSISAWVGSLEWTVRIKPSPRLMSVAISGARKLNSCSSTFKKKYKYTIISHTKKKTEKLCCLLSFKCFHLYGEQSRRHYKSHKLVMYFCATISLDTNCVKFTTYNLNVSHSHNTCTF